MIRAERVEGDRRAGGRPFVLGRLAGGDVRAEQVQALAATDDAVLLIQFDVDDKETFDLLDDDLRESLSLDNLPHWQTILRSDERLGMELGAISKAMGMVAEAPAIILRLAGISFVTWLALVVPIIIASRSQATVPPDGEQSGEPELPSTVSH